MSGLIAVAWHADRAGEARARFRHVCDVFTRLKSLTCQARLDRERFAVARFASPAERGPGLQTAAGVDVTAAMAGMWCDRAAGSDGNIAPRQVAERYLQHPGGRSAPGRGRDDAAATDAATAAFDGLDGHFLALIADARFGSLCDRPGIFPVYICQQSGMAWISTSASVLASALERPLNPRTTRAIFLDGAILPPDTAFQDIQRLAMGEQVTLRHGEAHVSRSWIPHRETARYRRIEEAAEDGVHRLRNVSRKLLARADAPVSDFTFGLDSRLVVAAMLGTGVDFGVTASGPPDHPDVQFCERVARRYGWPQQSLWAPADYGEHRWPVFRNAVVHGEGELAGHRIDRTLRGKRILARRHDVSVTGGLGEILRDFFWWQEGPTLGRTTNVNVSRLLRTRFVLYANPDVSLFRHDWRADHLASVASRAHAIAELAPEALNTAKLDALYLWKNAGHVGRYLGATASTLPTFSPLATRDLLEFATALPIRYRRRGRIMRHMIQRAAPELAALPTWYGGSAEPFSLRRPHHIVSYLANLGFKYTRRLLQIAARREVIKNRMILRDDPGWNRPFVASLHEAGLLDGRAWRTRGMYAGHRLDAVLGEATRPGFRNFGRLYNLVSLEALCRDLRIEPALD
jgi:hypothetical protein